MTKGAKLKNNHPLMFISFRVMNRHNYRKYDIFIKLPDIFNIFKFLLLYSSKTKNLKSVIVFSFCSFCHKL